MDTAHNVAVYATSSMPANTDVLIDELLGDFVSKPNIKDTPEDVFVKFFTGDKFGKVVILAHWLKIQGAIYDRAREYNLCIANDMSASGLKRETFVRYARVLIEHYLMSGHPHWFIEGNMRETNREPCDMGRVIDKLLTVESIKAEVFSKNRT